VNGADLRRLAAATVEALEPRDVAARRWAGVPAAAVDDLRLVEAFDLGRSVLAIVEGSGAGGPWRWSIPLVDDGRGGLREAQAGDGPWVDLASAAATGRTIPGLPRDVSVDAVPGRPGPVSAALVCRPAPGLASLVDGGPAGVATLAERPLGSDQSHTSAALGGRLVVKLLRRLEVGLSPELELGAYLSEEAGFEAVPRLGGFVEMVAAEGVSTVAIVSEWIDGGVDMYESIAETLTGWVLAPGRVALEFATEDAASLGWLTAGLHATLAAARGPDLTPRPATRDELRAWGAVARRQARAAVAALPSEARSGVEPLSSRIVDAFSVYEAIPTLPLLTRIHGDYHLGQVLRGPDAMWILDFEGDPLRPMSDRRALDHPLRDVASMLRSIDHVAGSAGRRARRRHGGELERVGLDLVSWRARARERFLAGYRQGLRESGAPIELDADLLRAFELEKEMGELIYASTYLPSWLWAPLEGLVGLLADDPA
jgi:trehalose synthase-fused probable maltokinase